MSPWDPWAPGTHGPMGPMGPWDTFLYNMFNVVTWFFVHNSPLVGIVRVLDRLELRAVHVGIDPTKFRVEWPSRMPIDARFTA